MKRTALTAILGAAPLVGLGCDSTVALDPTQPSLTTVYVSGVCRAEETAGDLTGAQVSGELDLSMVLLNQGSDANASLLPTTRVRGAYDTVENVIKQSGSIRFSLPQTATTDAPGVTSSAFAAKDSAPNEASGMALSFNRVDFEYAGGEGAKELDPYIILLMDQSASLIGKRSDADIDITNATDRFDQRISFFSELIQSLPDNYRVTVMGFSESFADDSQANQTLPSANSSLPRRLGDTLNGLPYRKTIDSYLTDLKSKNNLKIGTPLTKALERAHTLAQSARGQLRPIVVLFTDGLEDGDSSSNVKSPEVLSTLYSDLDVPVHVVHLQPPPSLPESRGRNKSFASLSCSTGGDYLFVESTEEFSKGNRLGQILANRFLGRWLLNVKTTLDDNATFTSPQGYLISTDISVTLGKDTRVYSASRSLDESRASDQRMWVYKP
jgi:hypothetical protein